MSHSACTALIPIMTSRLMLSLKEAAVEPTEPWSLSTMSDFNTGRDGVNFASRRVSGLGETVETSTLPNEEDMEFKSTHTWPGEGGSELWASGRRG